MFRILVVDDDKNTRLYFSAVLENAGKIPGFLGGRCLYRIGVRCQGKIAPGCKFAVFIGCSGNFFSFAVIFTRAIL